MKSTNQKLEMHAHKFVRAKVRQTVQPGTVAAVIDQELHSILAEIVNSALEQERDAVVGRAPYERSSSAPLYRNGHKRSRLRGLFNAVFVKRPVLRGKTPPSALFTALRRSGKNLLGILASRFWLRGAATRSVAAELNSTFGSKLSSADVSRLTSALVPDVERWLARPLAMNISYLFLDALYLPVRKSEFTTKQALLVAIGLTPEGSRHVLGFVLGDRENTDSWTALLKDLLARGLDRNRLLMVISDDHKAIDAAVSQTLAVPHQFCVVHKMRNALVRVAAKHRKAFLQDFKAIFWADSRDAAFLALGQLQERWQRIYPKATNVVAREPERFFRFFDQPKPLWTILRTSNLIERFNRELRRRLRPAGAMQTENELWKLVWSISIEQEKRWLKRRPNGVKQLLMAA